MTRPGRSANARQAAGFTLLSVLVGMIVMAVGLLGLARAAVTLTGATTQNQIVSSIATLSNGFWGVVQSAPSMLTSTAFTGSFTASNYSSAPTPLQPWLAQVTAALPDARVAIATGPDAGSGTACAVATGCTVTLTMQWTQTGVPGLAGATRSQTFYYQFGL